MLGGRSSSGLHAAATPQRIQQVFPAPALPQTPVLPQHHSCSARSLQHQQPAFQLLHRANVGPLQAHCSTNPPSQLAAHSSVVAAAQQQQQQQQWRQRRSATANNSSHVVRVVALQQDGSFPLDKKQQQQPDAADVSSGSSDLLLDVVPETGLLPEVVDRLDSNSTASSSSSSLPNPLAGRTRSSRRRASSRAGSSSSRASTNTNPIQTGPPPPTPAAAAAAAVGSGGGGSSNTSNSSSEPAGGTAGTSNSPEAAAAATTSAAAAGTGSSGSSSTLKSSGSAALYPPSERSQIQESWDTLMRWSKSFRRQKQAASPIDAAEKVVVFGGGSFGTAMGTALANKKAELDVVLLLRDPYLCHDINSKHINSKYLADFQLPRNVRATTDAAEAISGASYAVHAVPVQHSRAFLSSIRDYLAKDVPIICVSKGLEVGTGCMMSEVIPSALGRRQPAVFLSGPSFAKEVMQGRPTGVVAACKDINLGREIQQLFASPNMRVNTTTDVTGVEICGALKNVLAIAAGIVEGLDLGHNALAALIAQGCAEIRWLSQKVGAKPATISGLSGLGDIMLTCYGDLSRNRSVGIRLGKGERLEDILASSSQVAEGVATAGVVVGLARKYRVSLPVLTAVASVLDNQLTPAQAVTAVMNLPQIDER